MEKKISNKKKTGKENPVEIPVQVEIKQASPEVIQNIDLSMIACNPFNPRKYRNEEELEELTQSIVNFGIIQPVTLRVKGENYEIVCGERRYRASLKAGLSTIPAIVKNYSDEEAMEITILENLQRRDINPVEESDSFGKLMEVRRYSIDDLAKQFGKTDKYIRSRLQLRNLIDEVAELLIREEITLGIALELSRFCPDIQKNVYRERLSSDDSYSWKRLQTRELRKLLEKAYSADLSNYEFDKSDCIACRYNSSIFDLFAEGNCGLCQNMECLRYKQAEYMASETTKMLSERQNAVICVAPNSFASAEVVNNLADTGYEIYEMTAERLPVEPEIPEIQQFESETEYKAARTVYETRLQLYKINSQRIEDMLEQGTAQLVVDVSKRKPELGYRVIPVAEVKQTDEKDALEKLRSQDSRNREIAVEKAVDDVKRLIKGSYIPHVAFQPIEENMVYYIMLSSLRKENYGTFGWNPQSMITNEEKAGIIASLTDEQKNIIRRDFIIRHLSETFGDCKQSHLLLEFASLHFPDKVAAIKEQYNGEYRKKHIRIEERIRELQPFTGKQELESAEPETAGTFDDPDTNETPLYTGLPEHARIGEIPEEEEQMFNPVEDSNIAA